MKNPWKKIEKIQVDSIKENKENGFALCQKNQDFTVHDLETSYEQGLLIFTNEEEFKHLDHNCEENLFIGHSHGLYSKRPSEMDIENINHLIKTRDLKKIKGICTIGIDGLGCYDSQGELLFEKPPSQSFSKKFQKMGGKVIDGDSLYCDKKQHEYQCEMAHNKRITDNLGLFSSIETIGGEISLNNTEADFSFIPENKSKQIKCFSNQKQKQLFCREE